jgi:AcrR family transcriptional regulator
MLELVASASVALPSRGSMARTKQGTGAPEVVGDRRRRDLLAAAYELIAEKGLEGLRTRDIAARAGVNISTLHYYFGTKEALLEAVVLFVAEKFAGEGDLAQASTDPTLRAHIERAEQSFRSSPELAIVLQELALRAQRDTVTRKAFRPIFKFWNEQVEAIVKTEMDAGSILPADAHELALVVTSFIMGAMTQLGVNAKAFDFHALSRRLLRMVTASKR